MIKTARSLFSSCCSGFDERQRSMEDITERTTDFSSFKLHRPFPRKTLPPENLVSCSSNLYLPDPPRDYLDLPLRSPYCLLSSDSSTTEYSENGTTSGSEKQLDWIYPTYRLLKSSVEYTVLYLGKEDCYGQSNQQAVTDCNTNLMREMSRPEKIRLRINATSICLVSDETDKVTKKFKVQNVAFAAQDTNLEFVFSFIVQEKRRYMCHSFKGSTNLHTERVLMALGQAFEVAFQLKKSKTRFSTSDSGMNDDGSLPRNSDSESECSFSAYPRRATLPQQDFYP
ncbi:Oidioi.mRNA.OKI2018_I69.chr1.g985.t1.cds [Oikopleura dioica]|uniref:Oidioi.mRNA.OKI2018_I69.chr1.g985.t1.cds n=1 Tax=Oikopleura dioica TaxID=34765 RepID=A0ABN7SLK2_OIKDI|nr:Oidioi.mRNA.OKI2018_I69.chr1.g985.t1.cds [Oikopleura dioica]